MAFNVSINLLRNSEGVASGGYIGNLVATGQVVPGEKSFEIVDARRRAMGPSQPISSYGAFGSGD